MKKDADKLQEVVETVHDVCDVIHLLQSVEETFIERIKTFNDEKIAVHFTFEEALQSGAEGKKEIFLV